jgi:hypothetical protein
MSDQDELNKFDWLLDDLVDIGGVDGVEARDRRCAIKVKLSEMFEKQQAAARERDRLRERLSLIYGLTYDRDGRATIEGLGELVDEVCRIAQGQYTFEPGTSPEELRGEG